MDGVDLPSQETIDLIFEKQTEGDDVVLLVKFPFGIGYAIPEKGSAAGWLQEGRNCTCHGMGGSIVVMDVDKRMAVSYMMNKMQDAGMGSKYSQAYVLAAYEALEHLQRILAKSKSVSSASLFMQRQLYHSMFWFIHKQTQRARVTILTASMSQKTPRRPMVHRGIDHNRTKATTSNGLRIDKARSEVKMLHRQKLRKRIEPRKTLPSIRVVTLKALVQMMASMTPKTAPRIIR